MKTDVLPCAEIHIHMPRKSRALSFLLHDAASVSFVRLGSSDDGCSAGTKLNGSNTRRGGVSGEPPTLIGCAVNVGGVICIESHRDQLWYGDDGMRT